MEELINKIESQGWEVEAFDYSDGTGGLSIAQYSPAGEDFSFTINWYGSVEKAIKEIEDSANDFDEGEHVALWVEAKIQGNDFGKNIVCPSVRELVHDAEAIHNMLKDLAKFLINEYEIPLF